MVPFSEVTHPSAKFSGLFSSVYLDSRWLSSHSVPRPEAVTIGRVAVIIWVCKVSFLRLCWRQISQLKVHHSLHYLICHVRDSDHRLCIMQRRTHLTHLTGYGDTHLCNTNTKNCTATVADRKVATRLNLNIEIIISCDCKTAATS